MPVVLPMALGILCSLLIPIFGVIFRVRFLPSALMAIRALVRHSLPCPKATPSLTGSEKRLKIMDKLTAHDLQKPQTLLSANAQTKRIYSIFAFK